MRVGDGDHEVEEKVQDFVEWAEWSFGKTDDGSGFAVAFGFLEEEIDEWKRGTCGKCPGFVTFEVWLIEGLFSE